MLSLIFTVPYDRTLNQTGMRCATQQQRTFFIGTDSRFDANIGMDASNLDSIGRIK